jgi:hypothetical protein
LEFLEDVNIGLRNKSTARCFGGKAFGIRLDNYNVGGSMKAFNDLEALYRDAIQSGDRWTGILLTIFGDGQFRCRFYYDKAPLLDGDRTAVEKIISGNCSRSPERPQGLGLKASR